MGASSSGRLVQSVTSVRGCLPCVSMAGQCYFQMRTEPMPNRIAYLPLTTYPEVAPDPAILAAVGFAASLGCALHVSTFAVDVPQTASPISGFIINVEGLARATEDHSKAECERLEVLIKGAARPAVNLSVGKHTVMLGAAPETATTEARTFDLAILPWSAETLSLNRPGFSGDQLVRVTRPYRMFSSLHRMPPLPQRVGCFRWVPAGVGC